MVSVRPRKDPKTTSLRSGRPPLISSSKSKQTSLPGSGKPSSKTTRTLIRAHHNLHKSRAKALAENDTTLVTSIDAELEKLGGLEAYQAASLTGQSKDRGGDSSTILVKWLKELGCLNRASPHIHTTSTTRPNEASTNPALRILEVGSLSSQNAISALINRGVECVRRIDLKSQDPATIEEVDFMQFPIPTSSWDRYDVLSLSLVLNYVPDAKGRGDMLKRTRLFLRHDRAREGEGEGDEGETSSALPCLFLVLPLPCVVNSRYMTPAHLVEIMWALGYVSVKVHQSTKLHYQLFRYQGDGDDRTGAAQRGFKKIEINPGRTRNNFCVIVDQL